MTIDRTAGTRDLERAGIRLDKRDSSVAPRYPRRGLLGIAGRAFMPASEIGKPYTSPRRQAVPIRTLIRVGASTNELLAKSAEQRHAGGRFGNVESLRHVQRGRVSSNGEIVEKI